VVEKNVAGEKVFIGTLGSFETENGFVIVKDPAIPNPISYFQRYVTHCTWL